MKLKNNIKWRVFKKNNFDYLDVYFYFAPDFCWLRGGLSEYNTEDSKTKLLSFPTCIELLEDEDYKDLIFRILGIGIRIIRQTGY